jgi:hypothetical protein
MALHQQDHTGRYGPLVMGTWSWSADSTHLRFMPDSPLDPDSDYTVHVGGGMMDAHGNVIDLEEHGPGMGGQWITEQMMQSCMTQVCGGMMGQGWQHPDNGTFGMGFTFTTMQATALLSVVPAGGTMGVDPSVSVTMEFSHSMHMDMHVAIHEGEGVMGDVVDGTWMWSDDHMHLTFTPTMPFDSQTEYTVHIGGGMLDENGHVIDLKHHGVGMGGQTVTQQMMDQRMMNGNMMGDDMMGPGWRHPGGSTYGMIFTFTTG